MKKFLGVLEGIKKIAQNKYSEDNEALLEMQKILQEIPARIEIFEKKRREKNSSEDMVKYVVGFLNDPDNQYFYIKTTESFVKYNGISYTRVNEDEIWHAVYTYLKGCDPNIKHLTKNTILENIQNKSIFTSIPESQTIQNVINLVIYIKLCFLFGEFRFQSELLIPLF